MTVRLIVVLCCALCSLVALSDCFGEQGSAECPQEESETQMSLLQTSYQYFPGKPDAMPAESNNYGFPHLDDDMDGDQFLHEDGNHPFKPMQNTYFDQTVANTGHELEDRPSLLNKLEFEYPARRERSSLQSGLTAADEASTEASTQANPLIDPSSSWLSSLAMALFIFSIIALAVTWAFELVYETSSDAEKKEAFKKNASRASFAQNLEVHRTGSGLLEAGGKLQKDFHDVVDSPPIELDHDTFGMSVCSLSRDTYVMALQGVSYDRVLRIATSLGLTAITFIIQVYLLNQVKKMVSAKPVHDIRENYDIYEVAMYGKAHTTLTVNGKHRGIDGYMPPLAEAMKRLNALTDDEKDAICHIPLSQPHFFGVILLIWTLICFAELRKAWSLQQHIIMLDTVDSMGEAIAQGEDKVEVITSMTIPIKAVITVCIFIPRVLVTLYLLWLGCRWLLATTDFENLVTNAIALEFILLVKDALYMALQPARYYYDITTTLIDPSPKEIRFGPPVRPLLLFVIANLWVYCYMRHLQQVLPGYKWDVHDVCVQYMKDVAS